MNRDQWQEVFSPDVLQKNVPIIVDLLCEYLDKVQKTNTDQKVLTTTHWQQVFSSFTQPQNNILKNFAQEIIEYSQHLHHPNYIGHQVAVPLPMASIIDFLASFFNNSTAIIEMGPCHAVIEHNLIAWMGKKIGYSNPCGGFITAGGSLGNLMALLAARQKKSGYNVWDEGIKEPLTIMVSDNAHYCVSRAAKIMGLGAAGVTQIESDNNYLVTSKALQKAYQNATEKGQKVIAVVGSCCNTGPGTFENLEVIADFCENHNLWFHVDGAHGAPVLLSDKYKYLSSGIERADSVVWDLHKMMLMPSLCTGVIFRELADSYCALQQKAPYLYSEETDEKEWHTISRRTMECTKPSMGLKAHFCLQYYGEQLFSSYIETTFDLTIEFAHTLKQDKSFQLACFPQGNIVCFRYIPENFDGDLDQLQLEIRTKIVESGEFYIVHTALKNNVFLRLTIMNPLTSMEILFRLLKKIKSTASTLDLGATNENR